MNRLPIMFTAALTLMALTTGCTALQTDSVDAKTKIIDRTNAIYKNIKVIVTDPDISAMISDDAMTGLAEAERVYLLAVQEFEESDFGSVSATDALERIVVCADIILTVIDTLEVLDEYEPVITAVRLSVKLLRNNL